MKLHNICEDITDDNKGVYVMAEISKKSKELIMGFIKKNNIPAAVSELNLHITIIHSSVPFKKKFKKLLNVDVTTIPIKFDILNTSIGRKALVIRVKSKYLNTRFKDGLDAGARHDYPTYIPHVTLSYNFDGDIKKLNIKDFPKIHLVGERIEPINP